MLLLPQNPSPRLKPGKSKSRVKAVILILIFRNHYLLVRAPQKVANLSIMSLLPGKGVGLLHRLKLVAALWVVDQRIFLLLLH